MCLQKCVCLYDNGVFLVTFSFTRRICLVQEQTQLLAQIYCLRTQSEDTMRVQDEDGLAVKEDPFLV